MRRLGVTAACLAVALAAVKLSAVSAAPSSIPPKTHGLSNLGALYDDLAQHGRLESPTTSVSNSGVNLARRAQAAYAQGLYPKAEIFYGQARAEIEEHNRSESGYVAWVVNDLAVVKEDLGKYAEAEELYTQTRNFQEKLSSPLLPVTYANLASLYEQTGRWRDARELYEQALKYPGQADL